jgi:3'-phosphoadenosine 5'-phosphosulfate sulfotransferase (PAPS reductase)/FAD synthetase
MTPLPVVPAWPVRFLPSKDVLATLNDRVWVSSYSGGKDSTALVTFIEWLRRIGLVKVAKPRLVMSDTTVEYPFLRRIADALMERLTVSGWECEIVTPAIDQRLYTRIFGVGNAPTHPAIRRMRWCTRSTKTDPMKRFAKTVGADVVQLSGIRWGESDTRDGKLKASGCAAGGECGLPEPGPDVFSPIITWKLCKLLEWLNGEAGVEVNAVIADLLPMMRELVGVYEVKPGAPQLFDEPPPQASMRFGCVGCPAITSDKVTRSKRLRGRADYAHLRRLYGIWEQLYRPENRCVWVEGGKHGMGPVRMAVRKRYFAELLDIQEKSGVTLVKPDDEAFIRDCWERKVYPRGWSEADEAVVPPETGLYADAASNPETT